jgi:F420-dependent oxidoreductase-like protein
MKIAIGLAGNGPTLSWADTVAYVQEAERLGVDYAWSAEAWIRDAVAPLAYLAAKTNRIHLGTGIMTVSARTPGMVAMTATTLAEVSDGRFILGLGASGPQVIEGVHGVPYVGQLERIRETAEIVRVGMTGEPLHYEGKHYTLPRPGGAARRPLRVGVPGGIDVPIYVGAMSPAGLRLTGEVADGWIGHHFIPEASEVYFAPLREGAKKAGRELSDLQLQAGGWVEFGDDLDALVESRRAYLAFNLGGMGSAKKNFYNDVYVRAGFPDEAKEVQRLWLAGERDKAASLVPDEMVLQSQLVGPESRFRERVALFDKLGIEVIRISPAGKDLAESLETLGRAVDVVRDVCPEPPA